MAESPPTTIGEAWTRLVADVERLAIAIGERRPMDWRNGVICEVLEILLESEDERRVRLGERAQAMTL